METDGLRRSGRTRTGVKTFQAEQEEATLVLPIRKKTLTAKTKSKSDTGTAPIKDEPDFKVNAASAGAAAVKLKPADSPAPTTKRSRDADAHYDDTNPAKSEDEDAFDSGDEKPAKKKKKKKTRAKKSSMATGQLYGAPPAGTIIPWGTRWRKQPLIFAVTLGEGSSKKNGTNGGLQGEAENRVRETLESIRRLLPGEQEVRLRDYVDEPSEEYEGFLHRANTHKLFILSRLRGVEHDCHANAPDCPFENLQVAGSKGAVYSVRISHLLTCTCPSAAGIFIKKGEERPQCKHVIYVLHHVLKAPEHLKYQRAFLSSELKELFSAAPPLPAQVAQDDPKDGKRKELDGDCPICFTALEDQKVTWCRASCGNNIHEECLNEWAKAKTASVSCPYCRAEWDHADEQKVTVNQVEMPTTSGLGGYLNVYDQLQYK